jgi:hypothetical protein
MVTMMFRLLLVCCFAAAAVVHTSAQDPTTTLPQAYKVQLENDYVRVVRVHYAAGTKLPDHTHPAGTTVYVYLNDSDGVVFRHSGRSNRAVTRPAVKAGSIRVATGGEEHHTAENPAATPSDFLRIWLKTEAAGGRTMRRLSPDEASFTNQQLKISRSTAESNEAVTIRTEPNQPALLVLLPGGMTFWTEGGSTKQLDVNHSPTQYLRIDLLTPPK